MSDTLCKHGWSLRFCEPCSTAAFMASVKGPGDGGMLATQRELTALRAEVERLTARIRELEEARAALKGETINRTQEDIDADRQAVLNRMRALIDSTAPCADFEWQQLQHKLQDLMVESWSILPLPQEASDE